MRKLGVLRKIDPGKIAAAVIREDNSRWYNNRRPSTDNVASFLARYTLGQVKKPSTYEVKEVANVAGTQAMLETPMYQATLSTVLSGKVYVGEVAGDEAAARRSVASAFLEAPEVKEVFEKLPPKISEINKKVKLDEREKEMPTTRGQQGSDP